MESSVTGINTWKAVKQRNIVGHLALLFAYALDILSGFKDKLPIHAAAKSTRKRIK